MSENPLLNYAGTSGHADVETSRAATEHADVSGLTAAAQKYVLIIATQSGAKGVTAPELREKNGSLHHGRVSSALTHMHMAGRLVALREKRGHAGIYVLPEYVNGRDVRPYRRQRKAIDPEVIVGVLLHHVGFNDPGGCNCGWSPSFVQPSHRRHVAEMIAEALS